MNDKLRKLLIKHEGLRLKPYLDTVGKMTIGIGRNLDDRGISNDEANYLFMNDVDEASEQIMEMFPLFNGWSENRRNALIDMVFNMGITRFLGFRKMIAAIKNGDWFSAAKEMRNSSWAAQLPTRVAELSAMVEKG
jgi:lysozyme